jgi:23S rRNA pseudouridine1911/1915/1917 synthase
MSIVTANVPYQLAGMRLDQALAELFPDYSRSKLQAWIKAGRVRIGDTVPKAKDRVEGGETVRLDAEPEIVTTCDAEAIALDLVYEDQALLIVDKPAGLVVHPAAGNWSGTLQNALLHHDSRLGALPRAGIVHRIDKDTSGLLMVAKTLQAHNRLIEQLQARTIEREYLAITQGRMTAGGMVDAPIGRHPIDRKRNAVRDNGKDAVTHYRVEERFANHTLIRLQLETGRTHQIRVHMEYIHYPLLGDPVYGGRFRLPPQCSTELERQLRVFKRQALHAAKLGLEHPLTGDYCEWEAPLPGDMSQLLEALREHERILATR